MPVLGKLFGVECAQCREAGHRCQAQIIIDELALCMRCADDEPCVYVTAAAEPLVEEYCDPCVIPIVTRDDRRAIREMERLPLGPVTIGEIDPATRAGIASDRKLSANQLAAKFHVSTRIVESIRNNERRRRARAILAAQKICPEPVVSPMAVFGAEIIFEHLEKK